MPGSYTPPPDAAVVPIALYRAQCRNSHAASTMCQRRARSILARAVRLSFYTPFLEAHPSVVPTKVTEPGVKWVRRWRSHSWEARPPANAFLRRADGFTILSVITRHKGKEEPDLLFGANVGGGVWKRFTMTLDYHGRTMTLTPNGDISVRDEWDRSGLYLINKGGITVIDVRPVHRRRRLD